MGRGKVSAGAAVASAAPAATSNGMSFAETPLRILAGYSGKPQIDSAGAVWQPDTYFRAGGTWDRPAGFIARTSDPILFEHWRNGDFSYEIPLRPGPYELHLYFVAADSASNGGSTFTFNINDGNVLMGFDVDSDALGANVADERIFRDVSPASDGFLHLGFNSERGMPALNAIEILPGTPHLQLPIRLVMQPRSFTDHNGNFWHPDDYFMDGYTSTKTHANRRNCRSRHLRCRAVWALHLCHSRRYARPLYADSSFCRVLLRAERVRSGRRGKPCVSRLYATATRCSITSIFTRKRAAFMP